MNHCFNVEGFTEAGEAPNSGRPVIPVVSVTRLKMTGNLCFFGRKWMNRICFRNVRAFRGLPFAQHPGISF